MARPVKKGMDYFALDVDYYTDPKLIMLTDRLDKNARAVYIDLLAYGFGKHGYFFNCSDEELATFSLLTQHKMDEIEQVINACLDVGLFDTSLYSGYRILTSERMQEHFSMVKSKNRRSHAILKEHQVCKVFRRKTPANDTETPKNVAETPEKGALMPQSKEKKRKENKSKVVTKTVTTDTAKKDTNNIPPTANEILTQTIREIADGLEDSDYATVTSKLYANNTVPSLGGRADLALARWLKDKRERLYSDSAFLSAIASDRYAKPKGNDRRKNVVTKPKDFDDKLLPCPVCGKETDIVYFVASPSGEYVFVTTFEQFGFEVREEKRCRAMALCTDQSCPGNEECREVVR